ncbi:unnamed protein product [Cuscuta epithymum]|uniref:Uncharacterized protein n=1 Tax=Cuscuta epithymum TaxID=186058 RepID=A0AAV0G6E8_9ASTE|nr:unnamed protein product [Cuscuta epithymum]
MLNHESNEFPLCPKPRRLVSAHPEFLQPLSCSKHSVCKLVSEMNIIDGGRSEVLSIIGDHQKIRDVTDSTTLCSRCSSSSCYSGSPPGRTDNPLIHDVQFVHNQMQLFSPLTRTNKLGFTSTSPA